MKLFSRVFLWTARPRLVFEAYAARTSQREIFRQQVKTQMQAEAGALCPASGVYLTGARAGSAPSYSGAVSALAQVDFALHSVVRASRVFLPFFWCVSGVRDIKVCEVLL